MTDSEERIFEKALNRFGAIAQIVMVFEEMSELQKELCKFLRGKDTRRNIAEEIADVEIMLDQMKLHFEVEQQVTFDREKKVSRLHERLEMEESK